MSIELGRRLRMARASLNVSQAEIASKCGVTQFMVSKYESGQAEPGAGVLLKLAKALAVEPMYLLEACDGTNQKQDRET